MDRSVVKDYLDQINGKETTLEYHMADNVEYKLSVVMVVNLYTNEPFILMPRYRVTVDGMEVFNSSSLFDAIKIFESH